MAKKRKNTKGSKDANSSSDDQRKSTRSSSRKKNQKKRQSDSAADDYKLRNSVEADGLNIVDMNADGNCLFRALSDQLFGDYGNNHDDVRSDVCGFMEENQDDFKVFLVYEDDGEEEEDAKDFDSYISNMREDGEWGGNLELVAAARLFRRKVTVFSATLSAYTIEHGESDSSGPDLLLSFHDNDHYNSVRNNDAPPKPSSSTKRKTPKKKRNSDPSIGDDDEVKEKDIKEKDVTISTATSLSELSVADKNEVKANKKPTKKSAPCPCGSGLRYRKCCHNKEKHPQPVAKPKEQNGGDTVMVEQKEEQEVTMKGNFRVLSI